MRVFMDTEFTGLHQNTSLISIALVCDDAYFYGECMDYDREQVDDWVRDHVVGGLRPETICGGGRVREKPSPGSLVVCASRQEVAHELEGWLIAQGQLIEIWTDVGAYDWVLFCELFGGAMGIPKCVYYIPFDIATLLLLEGSDPDASRSALAGREPCSVHHALRDAQDLRAAFVAMQYRRAELPQVVK